jgi:hypothetical protein
MNNQDLIRNLQALQKDHALSQERRHACRNFVFSHAFTGSGESSPRGVAALLRNFSLQHLTPHTLPITGGIAMVLLISAGFGLASLRATPQNRLLYKFGSSLQVASLSFHSAERRGSLEVALLKQGTNDLTSARTLPYSEKEVETVVGVVEGRFTRVAGRLQTQAQTYPFVLLVDTAQSADDTEKALVEMQQGAPLSLQPKLIAALSAVTKAKRAALGVMVTYTDEAHDPEAERIVEESIGKELAMVQESIGSLLVTDADQSRVNAAGDVLVQAEKELSDGKYKITLSLINEAEELVKGEQARVDRGVVEGEAIELSNDFSTTTPPEYDTSTDVMIGKSDGLPEYSGSSDAKINTTSARAVPRKPVIIEDKPVEPEEHPVGFDL